MFALSRPGKPRTSVHKPDALMVCWIVLNPLQSSAPLAVGLALADLAAADPLNAMAIATAGKGPRASRSCGAEVHLASYVPPPMEVLPFRCRPRPVAAARCAGDTPIQRGDPKPSLSTAPGQPR